MRSLLTGSGRTGCKLITPLGGSVVEGAGVVDCVVVTGGVPCGTGGFGVAAGVGATVPCCAPSGGGAVVTVRGRENVGEGEGVEDCACTDAAASANTNSMMGNNANFFILNVAPQESSSRGERPS